MLFALTNNDERFLRRGNKLVRNSVRHAASGIIRTLEKFHHNSVTPSPAPTIPEQQLPRFNQNDTSQDDEEENISVLLDWPIDDRLFALENYQSLESLLNLYPNAKFRVHLATANDAYTHKIGNSLSVTQFTKYQRKGYDIQVQPVGRMMTGLSHRTGKVYWQTWSEKCCSTCDEHCRNSDHSQPYHVWNYIRLSKLWKRGGIFCDFSFFFLGQLTPPLVKHVRPFA